MSYHPDRHELSRGAMKIALKQLEFLVKAKIERINWMAQCKYKPTLLSFLADTRWAEVTKPQDKVYGILSLAEDAESLGYRDAKSKWVSFEVDYNLSQEQVFIDVAKAIICTTGSLDILRFTEKRTGRDSGLPSWVPNWAKQEPAIVPRYSDYSPLVSTIVGARDSWRPLGKGSDSGPQWRPIRQVITSYCSPSFTLGSNNALTIRGIHYDTIRAVSNHAWSDEGKDEYSIDPHTRNHEAQDRLMDMIEQHFKVLQEWIGDCTQKATKCSPYPTGESTCNAFWRTLNGFTARENLPQLVPPDGPLGIVRDIRSALACMKDKHLSMRSTATSSFSEIVLEVATSRFEYLVPLASKMSSVCASKRFATTRKKYMGLVPQEARVGDLICVMYGCETPFVLSRRRSGSRAFEFLGHSNVQGFDFDSAVVESRFSTNKPWLEKHYDFETRDPSGRRVYTTFKPTRNFTLV